MFLIQLLYCLMCMHALNSRLFEARLCTDTDLRHHLSELGLGDVGHAGVDDVYHLFRFSKKQNTIAEHTKKREIASKKSARNNVSGIVLQQSDSGTSCAILESTGRSIIVSS